MLGVIVELMTALVPSTDMIRYRPETRDKEFYKRLPPLLSTKTIRSCYLAEDIETLNDHVAGKNKKKF